MGRVSARPRRLLSGPGRQRWNSLRSGATVLFDRITPGSLWKELLEDQNTAIGVLMGCVAIAIAIIIAAAVH